MNEVIEKGLNRGVDLIKLFGINLLTLFIKLDLFIKMP
jgi:hypothetical protein